MSADTDGPLAGLRVLDLGAVLAGPFAATLLADFGAEGNRQIAPQAARCGR